ncbi:RNA polymerase sigma-70 factor, ECF subfamily [Quadrisphaera granulorum]|uniref:RNA polymerase sigma-70 factor (ECF subfamily) n=1 Tax=Quadrisphaera granulorum TaxID=317664 RepID=A0A316A2D7_9ACTN|nr:RNA polymerase sigma factor [Quadrisphaera granulorum]PWJ51140.1 RNA polymerase sigma-70 factor (ECF subfamily) [Quadrisphaera granulorum]SZE97790.1 RNA polymerase sigma-70 factor, ECF subfamily [Quadrisphaera granulorum]
MDPAAADDAALLRASARGDAAAFGELYDRLAPMVLVRLRRRCSDDDVVVDVLQEAFSSAWRAAGTWDGRGDVAAWVWTIAARRLVDAFRRRAVREKTAAVAHHGHVELEHLHATSGARAWVPSAEEDVVDGLLTGPLAAAVEGLSPELRAVLQATVLDGLSTREAAVLLGVPEGTVKTRAMRARAQVRAALA